MTVTLKDLRQKNPENKRLEVQHKEFPVKPWQSFGEQGLNTRTLRAKEAILRTKNIIKKNDKMVSMIRENIVSKCQIDKWELKSEQQQKKFFFQNFQFKLKKIENFCMAKDRTSFFSFLRDLL